jgi:DMSO/TMAO reductase YedYZ heme-binding membrane subunit
MLFDASVPAKSHALCPLPRAGRCARFFGHHAMPRLIFFFFFCCCAVTDSGRIKVAQQPEQTRSAEALWASANAINHAVFLTVLTTGYDRTR